MNVKLKRILMSNKTLWQFLYSKKMLFRHLYMLRFHLYDISNTYKYMFWSSQHRHKPDAMKAEVLFLFHKLEKGLIMPGTRRVFGEAVVIRLLELLVRWTELRLDCSDPVYTGAVDTLIAYQKKMIGDGFEKEVVAIEALTEFFEKNKIKKNGVCQTPMILQNEYQGGLILFNKLVDFRRSVREYEQRIVETTLIKKAVKTAQMSPSVCNRQASKVYFIQDREKINFLLRHQNGNAGFDKNIPSLAIITVDQNCFFNPTERNQPYIDGGLFTMSFLYALSAQGLASCCLNWCALPSIDKKVHREMKLPCSERIMMFVAIGYPAKKVKIPLSCRKDISDVFIKL